MDALLQTYNNAITEGLVDNSKLSVKGITLLPIYHSNKRAANDEDIFEISIDKNSRAIGGMFLNKKDIVIFPITEESIIRSGSKIAPHPISDELSYLAKEIDIDKNKEYMNEIENLLNYEQTNNCENFRIIASYIKNATILDDFLKFHLKGREYNLDDKFKLSYELIDSSGKGRKKVINLNKVFVTFKLEKEYSGDISITKDVNLHNFYIKYVENKNSEKELSYCDITGKLDYCIKRHRGIIGNAKLISISNHSETYYGRFKDGGDICNISFEASQKIHNMLKYLMDNNNHSRFIGENAYVINWLSKDLAKEGIDLSSNISLEEEDFEDFEEETMATLGSGTSKEIGNYFLGEDGGINKEEDYYVAIIEKISNGRVSMKYFRKLPSCEAYERVMNWYKSTNWRFYKFNKSPSLYQIVNFIYGQENSKGFLSCENKKLFRSTIERLIPCIIDSQKLPRDIIKTAFYKLSNKHSYGVSWNTALSIGCSLIKKSKNDYENCIINHDKISEVRKLQESKSFNYGRLIATYDKIEIDAIKGRGSDSNSKKEKGQRLTNADRLWGSMIRRPDRTRFILETKIKPYINILKRNYYSWYVFYEKLITEITIKLIELEKSKPEANNPLNEDFILGYYYQKDLLYQKNDNENKKEKETEVINEKLNEED